MKKRSKMLLSLFLSAMMVFSVVPSTVFAEPAHEETPAVQENTTEAVQDNTNTNEAEDPATEDSVTEDDATEATTDSSNTDTDENKVTISGITIQTPVIQFKGANAAVAEALTKDIKIDESDPAIQSLREALGDLEMVGGEAGTESNESNISTADLYEADEQAETKKLTEDQINTVVGMYQQYLNQWSANANVLGVQNPFFLDFNDDTDGLGILGQMLALDGKSVQDIRDGKVSYDDLTGMIFTFTYGDKLGIKYYGPDVTNARDEALAAVTASGAQTKAQKLLVLNDWLAHNNTFDMSYIMNSGKKSDDDKPMIAKDPQKQKHEDEVYDEIYKVYEPQIKQNFHDQIYAGIKQNLLVTFYENAIQDAVYKQALAKAADPENPTDAEKQAAQEQAKAYVEQHKTDIDKDPDAFARTNFGDDAADQLKEQADAFIKDAEENGVEADPENAPGVKVTVEQLTQRQLDSDDPALDMDGDGTKETSFKQAIPIYANQAATGMTTGVINYWEGTQFGAFGMGTSVCLGYSRAFSYLVQCLDKDIYLKDPSKGYDSKKTVTADGGTTSEVCDNWKTAKELYYGSDGKTLDINAGYTVDLVRISFQSNVTMYGEEQEDFGSDHYWNAVKVDGQWYYVDPCYTDVYTEVMSRDRVETDGDMNHVFFLFSDTDARKLYQGNFSVLRSLYQNEATDTTYEKAWMARAASNVYYADGYAYYMYDSTDLFDRVNSTSMNQSQKAAEYKIVRHKLTNKDTGDGDSDYETLINFTDKENDDDDDTFVSVLNKDGKMEKNDLLTKLYAQFVDEQSIYPSIGLTAALYTDGKIYFNVSNDIVSYNPADGAVAVVKEYNTVSAKRDTSKLFGGMAFTTVQDKTGAEQDKTGTEQDEKPVVYTVKNHPIAGLTVKGDNLVVSIGTNFAFISGKSKLLDHSSYGYEFEETDYNSSYTNYKKYQYIMGEQKNDNDEFMWSANFVDTVDLKTLTGDSHNYDPVSVPATCGRNAFTEERCTDCGLIKDGTRVEEEGTAHDHHFIKFHEVYYTKSNKKWNEADNYVCPECGLGISEPVAPNNQYATEQLKKNYEKKKALWEAAQNNAAEGHAYTATDAEWSDDHTSVTFQNLKCETCANQINKLDCLLESDENATNKANRDSIEKALSEKVTATAKLVSHTGTCDQGVTSTYKATGKTDDGYRYTASDKKTSDAGQHQYTGTWAWEPVKDDNGNVTGYTASVTGVKCSVCDDEPKAEQITVADAVKDTEKSVAATCTEKGKDVYTATATVKDAEGKTEIGTLTDTYEVELAALEHKYGAPVWNWTKGENNTYTATATFTCANDEKHVETVDAKVTEKSDGATCTEAGKITYTATVTFEGKDYTDTKTEEVAALGHNYGEPTWNWSKGDDGSYTAIATFTCDRCKDVQKVVATVGDPVETKATCTEAGKITYTATAAFNGKDYTNTKEKAIKAIGHKYGEPTWNWTKGENNTYTATATFTCANDEKHVETVNAKVTEKSDGATCTEAGKITYTATVTFEGKDYKDTKTEEVAALGHDYKVSEKDGWKWTADKEKEYTAVATFVCSRCKDAQDVTADVVKEDKNSQIIYKATAKYTDETGKEFTATATKSTKMSVSYIVHGQDYGWEEDWKKDGQTSGTEGQCKRLEAIQIKLPGGVSGSIEYRTHIQDIGWEKNWSKNGAVSGTEGQCKRLEAIQIRLTGEVAENYDVYYSVHAENFGWLGWAKNGEEAGTAGYGYRLEAIRIQLVTKGDKAPELVGTIKEAMKARLVGYQTHVQDYGTQAYVYDGAMAGTEGECKRMESIRMKLPSSVNSSIQYRSHVQDIGWEKNWASNGSLSGTTGQCKRLEAIQIKLSGDVAKNYDVYYRVHAQDYGWLAWAKNGESSGTEGYAKRLEAIEVRLVPKGTTPDLPASANEKAFIKKK